ncbi:hypothetical protein ABW19_dt0207592 [Dactylella cylindrospora]|nr:hypothetical protein ABW19_dt0207592 [Dactylella cylindrospora]
MVIPRVPTFNPLPFARHVPSLHALLCFFYFCLVALTLLILGQICFSKGSPLRIVIGNQVHHSGISSRSVCVIKKNFFFFSLVASRTLRPLNFPPSACRRVLQLRLGLGGFGGLNFKRM